MVASHSSQLEALEIPIFVDPVLPGTGREGQPEPWVSEQRRLAEGAPHRGARFLPPPHAIEQSIPSVIVAHGVSAVWKARL